MQQIVPFVVVHATPLERLCAESLKGLHMAALDRHVACSSLRRVPLQELHAVPLEELKAATHMLIHINMNTPTLRGNWGAITDWHSLQMPSSLRVDEQSKSS